MNFNYGNIVKLKPGVAKDHQLNDWPDDATGQVVDMPRAGNPERYFVVYWKHRGAKSVWAQTELEKVREE